MTAQYLESICIARFGRVQGKKLFHAMNEVRQYDFCVATAWTDHQIAIARSCTQTGRVFEFTESYDALILPEIAATPTSLVNIPMPLEYLSYPLIANYLPHPKATHKHPNCWFDQQARVGNKPPR